MDMLIYRIGSSQAEISQVGAGQELYQKACRLIPGGTQLLSKRPEMFLPGQWPAYYSKAKGVEVWDLDGKKYIDVSHCGVGAPILGFADPDVEAAVLKAVRAGTMSTLNCPEEVELAELLVELHPWAQMVRYARSGGEIMAVAIRIARAATGRNKVAFCGYHGWHDWYLAANLADESALDGQLLPGLTPAGVPRELAGTMFPFHYNHIEEFKNIVAKNGNELAAIAMEPARGSGPEEGFLQEIRATASNIGAVLIFDEITSGWRMNTGGIHLTYGVNPDMATFAKAMSNGYAMAAVIGIRDVMEAAQNSFISSTYWTERIGPVAALATIRKHRRDAVPEHLINTGRRVQSGWKKAAERAGLKLHISGIPPLSHLEFMDDDGAALATFFIQEMLDRRFLASTSFYATYAHQTHHIDSYLQALDEVFAIIANAIEHRDVSNRLRGPVKHSGFQRLT